MQFDISIIITDSAYRLHSCSYFGSID